MTPSHGMTKPLAYPIPKARSSVDCSLTGAVQNGCRHPEWSEGSQAKGTFFNYRFFPRRGGVRMTSYLGFLHSPDHN